MCRLSLTTDERTVYYEEVCWHFLSLWGDCWLFVERGAIYWLRLLPSTCRAGENTCSQSITYEWGDFGSSDRFVRKTAESALTP